MSTLSLALLAQFAAACPAAATVPLDRVAVTAKAESGFQTTTLHDNTTGRSYVLPTAAEAVALVAALHARGHRLDAGVMQVSDANWSRLGLTAESVFDPAANVCAGMTVLAEAYAIERQIERRVSCRYNTGSPQCRNGYPERIERAASRLRQGAGAASAAPAAAAPPAAPPGAPPPPSWDVWGQADFLDGSAETAEARSISPPAPAFPEPRPVPPDVPPETRPVVAPLPDPAADDGAASPVAMVTGTPVRQ